MQHNQNATENPETLSFLHSIEMIPKKKTNNTSTELNGSKTKQRDKQKQRN